MIEEIFKVCIIPLLGILTTYIVKYIQSKREEISVNIDNITIKKYTELISSTITTCVIATNQTYVNALKEQNKFDKEAQKIAFTKTAEAVLSLLTDESKKYIKETFGDLNTYIIQQIEATVKNYK